MSNNEPVPHRKILLNKWHKGQNYSFILFQKCFQNNFKDDDNVITGLIVPWTSSPQLPSEVNYLQLSLYLQNINMLTQHMNLR